MEDTEDCEELWKQKMPGNDDKIRGRRGKIKDFLNYKKSSKQMTKHEKYK